MPAPKKYSDELKERAVRLVFESQRPVAHVARDLGINKEALRLWVRQAEADAGVRKDRLTSDERERLKALERENRELRKANEILKAASVFFAKELDGTRGGERVHRPGARALRRGAHLPHAWGVAVGLLRAPWP
ncbi:MAG: transposase [Solirubrobacteraceae bacterium]|nr:transposase [Solirubrobacteraceae bacterium]